MGCGFLLLPSPSSGNSICKGCKLLAGFTAPLLAAEPSPQHSRVSVLSWSPASPRHMQHPPATASFSATACACSQELLQGSRCPRAEMPLLMWFCLWKWVAARHHCWGKWEQALGQVTCTLWSCHLYFWLLQVGASAIVGGKKNLLKLQQ